jgi:hypothetical protein
MDVVGGELFYFAQVPVESFFQEIQAKAKEIPAKRKRAPLRTNREGAERLSLTT